MASFIRHDLIAEKLEIARTIGLVTDYRIGQICPTEATVKIWHGTKAADSAVKHYLAGLLDGLVCEHDITIMPAAALGEAVSATASQPGSMRSVAA